MSSQNNIVSQFLEKNKTIKKMKIPAFFTKKIKYQKIKFVHINFAFYKNDEFLIRKLDLSFSLLKEELLEKFFRNLNKFKITKLKLKNCSIDSCVFKQILSHLENNQHLKKLNFSKKKIYIFF